MPPKPPKEIGEGRLAKSRLKKRCGEVASKSRKLLVLAVLVKFGKARRELGGPKAVVAGVDKTTTATRRFKSV